MHDIDVLNQSILYKGYFELIKNDLKLPSFNVETTEVTQKERECLKTPDSVFVLIYVLEVDSFLFCEEFRIGIHFNENNKDDPFLFQGVAGTIEKNECREQTAKREVLEETGLTIKNLEPIASIYKSPGIMTEKAHLFFTQLEGIPSTGVFGINSEQIKTHLIKRKEAFALMDNNKILDSSTLLSLQWFKLHKIR